MVGLPPKSALIELLSYDKETGALTWRRRDPKHFEGSGEFAARMCKTWNARWADKPALTKMFKNGYLGGSLLGRSVYAHRVIWKLLHGSLSEEIDHQNGDRTDNRLANLQAVSKAENAFNKRISRRNTTGVTGVSWNRQRRLWQAEIQANGQSECLGHFTDFQEAVAVRKQAEIRLGFHENHGDRLCA